MDAAVGFLETALAAAAPGFGGLCYALMASNHCGADTCYAKTTAIDPAIYSASRLELFIQV